MFFSGDLQSGIKAAIQQSKLVVCFVGDHGEESIKWKDEFLADRQVVHLIAEKTILLHLQAGSEEAGYLAAIYPLPKTPTLVIMQNGQLKEYLNAGVSKEDFLQRIRNVLSDGSKSSPDDVNDGTVTPASTVETSELAAAGTPRSDAVEAVLEERRARLEAAKKQQDACEKAERAAKAAAKKESLETATSSDPKKAASMKYALLQKRRQRDAQEERARILKRVEDDKAERRARDALRKEQARVASGPEDSVSVAQSDYSRGPTGNKATECAIQVRLFDGSTIRSRFPSHNTLSKQVREWIDGKSDGSRTPYNFKQILTPLPNRTIEMSDEEETLQNLVLAPSATFVLVPIKDYTSAYEGGTTGLISRGISTGFGLVSSGIGLVTGVLSTALGSGSSAEVRLAQNRPPSPDPPARDQQLYNGNALNFEPRRDDKLE